MDFKSMLLQIGQIYQNLTRKQRIVIAASIVIVIGFLVFLSLYHNSESGGGGDGYGVLVENVSPSSSAAIVSSLEQNNVPYKLRDETTILVPQDQVLKQRMFIASE
ncbi:MAG: flagellar M-ring protein FliF, partial [Campylobacter sp.]|nr:flagellar M-ring protein FliF [Campylobacter sp.]